MEIAAPVRERPIPFRGSMVRAILADEKRVTRRLVKPQTEHGPMRCHYVPSGWAASDGSGGCRCSALPVRAPAGDVGDLLWVRETCWINTEEGDGRKPLVAYRADGEMPDYMRGGGVRWRPPMFMPRWASRLTLRVTDVRAERLQEIAEEDARAEGILGLPTDDMPHDEFRAPSRAAFARAWDAMHGTKPGASWADSPWVWRIAFDRVATVTP